MERALSQSIKSRNLCERPPKSGIPATTSAASAKIHNHDYPFVVQSVLESLLRSDRYRPITEVVAGEADAYCAFWVRRESSEPLAVLTGDSDLLIHDLGETGSVVFYTDLESIGDGFQAHVYSPAQIVRRLSLPQVYGMSAIAFERASEPHASFQEILERAQKAVAIEADPSRYKTFMSEYTFLTPEMVSEEVAGKLHAITGLDPRISELAVYCARSRLPAVAPETRALCEPRRPEIFLPPLAENWARRSVWETSTSIRLLAYTFMQQVDTSGRVPTVWEHHRCTSLTAKGKPLEVPPTQSLDDQSSSLLSTVRRTREVVADVDMQWITLSMFLDLDWHREDGKSTVQQVLGKETEADGTLDMDSWNVVHWYSQITATCYSLRILSQVLGWLARESLGLSPTSQDLSDVLSSLPPIARYPDYSEMRDLPGRIKAAGGLDVLRDLVGLSEPLEFGGKEKGTKKGTKKRKWKRAKGRSEERVSTSATGSESLASQNPYAEPGDD